MTTAPARVGVGVPRSGDVLHITRAASVQFVDPFLFRVIRPQNWPTYDGWIWLDGYQLDEHGEAVKRGDLFVQVRGIEVIRLDLQLRRQNVRGAGGNRR
jgi:hypothetical protein